MMTRYRDSAPARSRESAEEIVEVKLWEAFLLYNRHNVYRTLAAYSLDNGPLDQHGQDLATVTFRFTSYDWSNTLKDLLAAHNIPVIREGVTILEY